MKTKTLKVSDYTKFPYARYRDDGDGNGEEFRDDFIAPILAAGSNLIIDLDGVVDEYGSSFLDEAFANLLRKGVISPADIDKRIEFKSDNQQWLAELKIYIDNAKADIEGKNARHHVI